MSVANDEMLSPAQVAAMFGVKSKTITTWARSGKIVTTRTPGGHHRFLRSDVERALRDAEARQSGGPETHT